MGNLQGTGAATQDLGGDFTYCRVGWHARGLSCTCYLFGYIGHRVVIFGARR